MKAAVVACFHRDVFGICCELKYGPPDKQFTFCQSPCAYSLAGACCERPPKAAHVYSLDERLTTI